MRTLSNILKLAESHLQPHKSVEPLYNRFMLSVCYRDIEKDLAEIHNPLLYAHEYQIIDKSKNIWGFSQEFVNRCKALVRIAYKYELEERGYNIPSNARGFMFQQLHPYLILLNGGLREQTLCAETGHLVLHLNVPYANQSISELFDHTFQVSFGYNLLCKYWYQGKALLNGWLSKEEVRDEVNGKELCYVISDYLYKTISDDLRRYNLSEQYIPRVLNQAMLDRRTIFNKRGTAFLDPKKFLVSFNQNLPRYLFRILEQRVLLEPAILGVLRLGRKSQNCSKASKFS